jgi:hypothetical protein
MACAKTARVAIPWRKRGVLKPRKMRLYSISITHSTKELAMTLCPVALVSGCAKCPIFKPCPLKGVIGDYKPDQKDEAKKSESPSKK